MRSIFKQINEASLPSQLGRPPTPEETAAMTLHMLASEISLRMMASDEWQEQNVDSDQFGEAVGRSNTFSEVLDLINDMMRNQEEL